MMVKLVSMIFAVPIECPCNRFIYRLFYRIKAHSKECNVVTFNPFNETLFCTAASDATVALWDTRNTSHPLHYLEGHTDAVFSGSWCPTQPSVLATGGLDRRVIVWDLSRVAL